MGQGRDWPGLLWPSCLLGPALSRRLTLGLGLWLGRLLRVRELERQKARTLRLSWKLDQPTPEESQATPQDLQVRLEGSEEKEAFKEDEVEEKEEVSGALAGSGFLGI